MDRVIICGCRHFDNYELLKEKCNYYTSHLNDIEVVSGRCSTGVLTFVAADEVKVYGADGLGERWAAEKGHPVKAFPADWNKYGKRAGPIRNELMSKYSDYMIAFWDNNTTDTKDMIEQAEREGLKVKVVLI